MVSGVRTALAALTALALVALPAGLSGAGPAYAADQVVETAYEVVGTPEADGTPVTLDATLLTTDPEAARPAVVLAHGFGGSKADLAPVARTLAEDGYAVITYTARGFGASGGLIHLNHRDYEGEDARRIVDFAASRVEVAREGDDPVIGFAGASYGGALALLVAGLDARVDAIVPAYTWHSLSQSLFPQHRVVGGAASPADVTPDGTAGVFKQRWAALLFAGGMGGPGALRPSSGDAAVCGRFDPALCSGYVTAAETGRPTRELLALLDESGMTDLLPSITAPTLIVQGEQDTLFPLDQADANYRGLPAATPAAMAWVEGGHDGEASVDSVIDSLTAWFGRHLKGEAADAATGFSVVLAPTSLVGQGGNRDPETRRADAYPGSGSGLEERRIGLSGDVQSVLSPPGGAPAALTNLPGTGGVLAQAATLAGYSLGVLPGQSATFTTETLAEPLDLIGGGRVDLEVTSDASTATLFVSVWISGRMRNAA